MPVTNADQWSGAPRTTSTGGRKFVTITKSDTDELEYVIKAFMVGTAGDVAVMGAGDTVAVTLPNCVAGIWHPGQYKQILETGTEPTEIVGMYDDVNS